jgi:8-oxo-dGTP pyrophosphatase MutT (NUDIX family)
MTENPWARLARRVAYENPWITVWHDDVIRPDGQPGIYGVVHYRNLAVGVVALDEEDRILLVGQYRYPLDLYSWELPEGGAPAGEGALAAAKRELLEETGCTAAHWEEVLRAHLSNSVSDEAAVLFLAHGLAQGEAVPEGTERLQVRRVHFAEALGMVQRGEITDAMSVMGIQCVALRRALQSRGGGERV